MTHLFKDDWIEGAIFDVEAGDYNEIVNDKTVVVLFCGEKTTLRSEDWVYSHEYASCQDCLSAYSMGLLAEVP